MADYGVNIAVAVKNSQAITKLSRDAKTLSGQIDNVNKNIEDYANLVGKAVVNSTANFSKALQDAAENLNKVALNGDKATRAARDFLDAQLLNNEALEEQKRLLREVFLAGKPLQATPFGPQPFSPQKQLADEGKTRARLLAIQADKESGLRQERFQATSDFLNKMHSLEISLGKKANSIEIDNIIKEFEVKERLEKAAFDNAIRLDIEEGKNFDKRYKARMEQRAEDDKRRARLAKRQLEEIMLTGQTSPIGGAVGIPGSPAALRAAERAQRIRSAQSSALIGGAFPLLFGQGLGASIGGAAGGFGGGMVGGEFGFGLSLIGTQIGSMFDQLASEAAVLGQALNQNAFDYEKVAESVGLTGTSLNGLVTDLSSLEDQLEANALATGLLAARVGDEGVQALEEFGAATQSLSNEFAIAMTLMQSEVAKFFRQVVQGAAKNLQEFNLLASGLTSKDPRQVKLAKQRAELLGQRDLLQADTAGVNRKPGDISAINEKIAKAEQDIRDVQKEIIADAGKRVRLAVELEKRTTNELALGLQSAKTIDLRKQALAAEGEERLRLNAEAEKSALQDQFRLDKQKAITRGIKGELSFRAVANDLAQKQITLDEATFRINKNLEDALDRKATKVDRKTKKAANEARRASRESEREQKAIDRANEALDRINRTYTNKLALQAASTEMEAELLKIDHELEAALIRINKLRKDGGDPAEADKAEALITQFSTRASSGIFGDLGDIADMPSFAGSIEMSNSLLLTQEEQIQKLIEKYPLLGQAADAAANMMTFGIMSFVDGTKTAEEVFADFLRSIADMLFRTAQQMIAQYIILGVARAFGLGVTPSFDYSGMDLSGSQFGPGALGGFPIPDGRILAGRANGGSVSSGRSYLVGERGPELFVPGAQGNIVPNDAMGGANVTVNVDASGSSVQGDGQNAAQLGKAIGLAVQTELRKQQRPGGILAR